MLVGGVLAVGMPLIHMSGAGLGGDFPASHGAFFFLWTFLAIGATGTFSIILAVRALWSPQWSLSR